MKRSRAVLAIAALALLPVLPYAFFGYAGHDFEFHVSSWMEVRDAWLTGTVLPGWAARANFGLGDPHLLLYPPLSLLVGGLLSLVSVTLAPALFVWMAITAAGLTMYAAAKPFVSQRDRLAAALLYMFSPYLLTTALVRFAAGELLVQVWVPLLLMAFYQAVWIDSRRATLLMAALLGDSWVTNIPESLILFYGLLFVAILCAWDRRSIRPVLRFAVAEAIGGAVAAFYLLPMWMERGAINLGGLVRSNNRELLLFMPHAGGGPEPGKLFKYSLWLIALGGMALIAVCLRRRARRLREDAPLRTWLYLAGVAIFFESPLSILLWDHLPKLDAAQFGFRFLPLVGAVLPLVLLARGTRISLRRPVQIAVGLIALLPLAQHVRVQSSVSTRVARLSDLEATWHAHGYQGLAEYWPVGLAPVTVNAQKPVPLPPRPPSSRLLPVDCAEAVCAAPAPLFYFPYWRATDESGRSLPTARAPDGRLVVSVPHGIHTVRLALRAASPWRLTGLAVSFGALILLLLGFSKAEESVFTASQVRPEPAPSSVPTA